MGHYDGPAFYRKFPTRRERLNKEEQAPQQIEKNVKANHTRRKFNSSTTVDGSSSAVPEERKIVVNDSDTPVSSISKGLDEIRAFHLTKVPLQLQTLHKKTNKVDYKGLLNQVRKSSDSYFLFDDGQALTDDVIETENHANSLQFTGIRQQDKTEISPIPSIPVEESKEASQEEDVKPIEVHSDQHNVAFENRKKRLEEQIKLRKQRESEASPKRGLGQSLGNILNDETNLTSKNTDLSLFNKPQKSDEVNEVIQDKKIEKENISVNPGYTFPSSSLLKPPVTTNRQDEENWTREQEKKLNATLQAFNVNAKVVNWTIGPTVTQFQVNLALGVKVSKITNLTDDLKLALSAKDIRIEAPIPGRNTVGIEIPNPKPRPVMLSEIVNSEEFKTSKSPLTVALGVDLFGKPQVTDLRKMPHGLIAGATGSGKSVFINSVLISLLYKATPAQLRLLLIDPKAVEMAPYDGIPHLLAPVISDPKVASAALKWVVNEMDQRYERLAAGGARNIEQFNQKAEESHEYGLKMPYIVIVIDELADLMMVASNEVEDYIVRITQKARAAGIHLLVATQRPSVDVVTGTIKNNIPTRIAFMVSSQIDSRTILDTSGAERLLGRGDMLYLGNGASQPVRFQGAFIDQEVDAVTDYVRKQQEARYEFAPDELVNANRMQSNEDRLMPQVLTYISAEKNVSTSKLQRVFSIGYNRAANLIDELESRHFISEQHGSKPRDVYFSKDDLESETDDSEL